MTRGSRGECRAGPSSVEAGSGGAGVSHGVERPAYTRANRTAVSGGVTVEGGMLAEASDAEGEPGRSRLGAALDEKLGVPAMDGLAHLLARELTPLEGASVRAGGSQSRPAATTTAPPRRARRRGAAALAPARAWVSPARAFGVRSPQKQARRAPHVGGAGARGIPSLDGHSSRRSFSPSVWRRRFDGQPAQLECATERLFQELDERSLHWSCAHVLTYSWCADQSAQAARAQASTFSPCAELPA